MFFECLWPKYEGIFDIVKKNIEQHKGLIDWAVKIQMIEESRERDEDLKRHQEEILKRHLEETLKRHQAERNEAFERHQEECDSRGLDRLERNIAPHDYRTFLEKCQRDHCPETGKWIFSDPLFKSWLGSGSNEAKQRLLWLAGVPGAGNPSLGIDRVIAEHYIGKTFLCYSILQHLQEMAPSNESTYILYAFSTHDNTGGNTKAAIIRSLLYQLCRANQSLIPVANKEHDTRQSHGFLLNIWDKLLETFIRGSEPVYIILDGLDECDEIERKQLLKTILDLWRNCPNLRLLVSSRKEVDIRQALGTNCETLIVEEKSRTDIKRFVTSEINDLWRKIRRVAEPGTGEFFKALAHSIVNQSEGAGSIGKIS